MLHFVLQFDFFFVSLNFTSALKNSGLNGDTLSHVSELEVT